MRIARPAQFLGPLIQTVQATSFYGCSLRVPALVHYSVYNKLHMNIICTDLSLFFKTLCFLHGRITRQNESKGKVLHQIVQVHFLKCTILSHSNINQTKAGILLVASFKCLHRGICAKQHINSIFRWPKELTSEEGKGDKNHCLIALLENHRTRASWYSVTLFHPWQGFRQCPLVVPECHGWQTKQSRH